jgi:CRP-like cAMP-binding protein
MTQESKTTVDRVQTHAGSGTTGGSMVAVLDADPELGADLDKEAFQHARREALAPLLNVPVGTWSPSSEGSGVRGHLGLLVLDGLLARSETVGELRFMEFLGFGDVLRPWVQGMHAGVRSESSWRVLKAARIAVLDQDFALRANRWPEIAAALLDRAVMRSRSLGVRLAIHRAVRVEDRVQLMLWYLADRWGYVTPKGTVLPIPLTHEVLARLVGARRSPVTVAVGKLRREGVLGRGPDGSWLLLSSPAGASPSTIERASQASQTRP